MDFLSVDIDYNDFYVLHKILTKYRPRVICAEFNCSRKFKDNIVVYTNNYYWDRTNYFNAGIISYQKLCDKFKYDLVYCDKKGVNLFFVDKKFKASKKFADVNCPIKLWRKCNYGVKLPNGKIMNSHKNDYNCRIYVNFNMATSTNFVKKLDEINASVAKYLNSDFKSDVELYIKLTTDRKYGENMKVAISICRKMKQLINKKSLSKLIGYSGLLRTIILNNLVIKFRETDNISKKKY